MNIGPNQPTGGHEGQSQGQGRPGGRRNRRRRNRRGGQSPAQGAQPGSQAHGHQSQGQHRHGQQQPRQHQGGGGGQGRRRRSRRQPAAFTGPMDHSYRTQANGNDNGNRAHSGRQPQVPRFFQHPDVEPIQDADAQRSIFAFVDELFFVAKIQETARKLNVKVDFVKTEQDVLDRVAEDEEAPALIIVDLNSNSIKPLTVVHKLKAKFKRATNIIGFLSHIQGDLKLKAVEAGCDMVVPRSAFSQNLPQILRRHAASEEEAGETIQ